MKCRICKEEKELNNFYKNKTKLGYFTICISCHKNRSIKNQRKKIKNQSEPLTLLENEIFKEYKKGLFVSNLGRVYRSFNALKNYYTRSRFVKPTVANTGYYVFSFNGKTYQIHRIVAELFVENNNNYNVVNHIDYNRTNNHYENLEWTTIEKNTNHSVKSDRYAKKLDRDSVIEILKSKKTVKELSIFYNVSKVNIRLIKKRKIWKHI